MTDPMTVLPGMVKRIGIASDHGGFALKQELVRMLRQAGYEVSDYGDSQPEPDDDYPDFVVPLARAVASGEVDRGVAVCGSGVGACVAANKVPGVRAGLVHETFSAHQGVEDDNMNVICLGGLVVGQALAWELVRAFLARAFQRRRAASSPPGQSGGAGKQGGNNVKENHLKQLGMLGQSIWLDYIRRDLIAGGELRRLIKEDGLRGMTSNPSIFEKAIAGSHEYDEDIRTMALDGKDCKAIYEALSQHDVQGAADEFRPVYDETDGKDGYVSLEVNPHLAHDTEGTIAEARRLWAALNRPNVFIKVPATTEGLPAIQQLISEGINVNVTLLFGLPRYRQVAEAYITGMEECLAQGKPVKHVASVASFFVSRIDTLVDPLLEKIIAQGGEAAELAKKAAWAGCHRQRQGSLSNLQGNLRK